MTGIFIIARLGSTRLQRKHLIEAGGKSFIEWLVERFASAFHEDLLSNKVSIHITTSDRHENRSFESVFATNPLVKVFYGADENIPLRQLQCAEANGISEIISIDGDDIMCSTNAALKVAELLQAGKSYVKTTGLPLGMNVMGYKTEYLKGALSSNAQATLETGWGRIFNENDVTVLRLGEYDADARLRLTLDYDEDALFFKRLIEEYPDDILSGDDVSLINFILKNQLYELNQSVNEKYWKNFDMQKQSEN